MKLDWYNSRKEEFPFFISRMNVAKGVRLEFHVWRIDDPRHTDVHGKWGGSAQLFTKDADGGELCFQGIVASRAAAERKLFASTKKILEALGQLGKTL